MKKSRLIAAFSVVLAMGGCNTALAAPADAEQLETLVIGGYSSAGFQIHPGGDKEAALNEVSVTLSWDNQGKLRLFGEFEVEKPLTWEEGGAPPNTGDAYFDVERLYADYSLSGMLNLRGGRYLTPIGRWNLIHAAPLVWTSTRPAATDRLFPLSLNGAMLHGAVPWGNEAIEYAAYVEAVRDQSHDPGEIRFKDTRGLRINYTGAMEVGLNLSQFALDEDDHARYNMIGLDFLKAWNGWEVSGEIYQRERRDDGGDSGGGYLQGVAPLGSQWFGVARVENLREEDRGTTSRWLLGTAWRYASDRVIKFEYAGGKDEHPDMPRGFIASFAILF